MNVRPTVPAGATRDPELRIVSNDRSFHEKFPPLYSLRSLKGKLEDGRWMMMLTVYVTPEFSDGLIDKVRTAFADQPVELRARYWDETRTFGLRAYATSQAQIKAERSRWTGEIQRIMGHHRDSIQDLIAATPNPPSLQPVRDANGLTYRQRKARNRRRSLIQLKRTDLGAWKAVKAKERQRKLRQLARRGSPNPIVPA